MGLQIKDLVTRKEITIHDLKGQILAVDTMNLLYQFLTTIRGPTGGPLTSDKGQITSHLVGLFNRTTSLMEEGIKLAFVFDGIAPAIKQKTWEKRAEAKAQATLKLRAAEEQGDYEQVEKYSRQTTVLTREMVSDAKRLIASLGCPIINAPSEGEAQAAHIAKTKRAYAAVSQDYDTLIFGCPIVIRNLSIDGKRKKPGTLAYEIVKPEQVELQTVLTELKLTEEQLQILAILIGTDYNPGGIKGIGPKKALKLLHEHGTNYPAIFDQVGWAGSYPNLPWPDLLRTIKEIPVTDEYQLEWTQINQEELTNLLVNNYGFSEERIKSKLVKLSNIQKEKAQTGLSKFF